MRRTIPSACAGALLALATLVNAGAATEKSAAPYSRRNPIVEAVQKTKQSIVTVKVPRPNGGKDLVGTGVIVDERGFIVTNRHVVGSARSVKVVLLDGTESKAEVVLTESAYDLAVLRVQSAKKLQALQLAPADDLLIGETVIAVGHPFGYSNTVSVGIISALNREISMPSGETLTGLIQTDASINPGNSGGPLLNINGELIGINVALRDGAQGIAFAINADTVKHVLSDKLSALKIAGVFHGLACKEKVLGETGDRQRVIVAAVHGDKEVHSGDEILTVGERRIVNAFDVERALWDKKPGETVHLTVLRQGKELTIQLTLAPSDVAIALSKNEE
ncbi:MAG: trypsin-like peptidase domain-containing protein [Gemmataceae bacterium]|nr:trypsin-like peptidase domain-containing protein [Gemmataceae bacterium]MCI0741881.1 trypsin-like peptidase domain-containing protein [Gemmataceae bacterium]